MPKKYMNYDRTQELIYGIRKALDPKPKIVTWSDGTDEEICAVIQGLDEGTITTEELGWDVGDERVIHLNAIAAGDYNNAYDAQDQTFVIMEVSDYNGVGHYIVGMKDLLYEQDRMEASDTNQNGWHNSRGRKVCDAIFEGMIPSTIKPIFKEFTVTSATKGNTDSSGVTDQTGKLSLFAEKEVFEKKSYSTQDEFNSSKVHSKIEWYKTSAHSKKTIRTGSPQRWWLRSPVYYLNTAFTHVASGNSYGSAGQNTATTLERFSPFGVI